MNGIFDRLKEMGFQVESVVRTDGKGRITIPVKIRNEHKVSKYYLCTFNDLIVLKGVD